MLVRPHNSRMFVHGNNIKILVASINGTDTTWRRPHSESWRYSVRLERKVEHEVSLVTYEYNSGVHSQEKSTSKLLLLCLFSYAVSPNFSTYERACLMKNQCQWSPQRLQCKKRVNGRVIGRNLYCFPVNVFFTPSFLKWQCLVSVMTSLTVSEN
jgi:hypothetical protein